MPSKISDLKVAIVHDWLVGGGAELVVEQLHNLFPSAPIYTSYATDEWRQRLNDQVHTGWLQRFGRYRKFLPIARMRWFSQLDLSGYDLVISSSGAEAKGIRVSPGTLHINYCHAPTHYYWSRYDEYLKHPGFGSFDWLARLGLKLLVGPLRRWDYRAAQRPDFMIANSTYIQSEIKKYYGRDSEVIHPPVDTAGFSRSPRPRTGFLAGGRLTAYKHNDLAVIACSVLQLPLTIFGDGPDLPRLKALAGPTVQFVGKVPQPALVDLFVSSQAFLFGSIDDFGIVSVESLAAGTPVIALRGGGALDYIIPGKTGDFFDDQTSQSLQTALRKFKPDKYHTSDIIRQAQEFSISVFMQKMEGFIKKACFNE